MRVSVIRLLTTVSAGAACTLSLVSCHGTVPHEAASVADSVSKFFSSDPSLLTPAVPRVYELHGEIHHTVAGQGVSPLTQSVSTVTCRMKVEDGVLVEAVMTASLDGVNDLIFELTEPVVFEYDGKVKEQVVGTGTLTVDASVYPESRILFEPSSRGGVLHLDATLPVPESAVNTSGIDADPLYFSLESGLPDR